jgi:hypothetical protein
VRFASASFRDPDARVFIGPDERLLRALSATAAEVDAEVRASGLMDSLVRDGILVENARCTDVAAPDGWAAVVESKRLPFVNYPYEWSFGMLRDAALLTLDVTERVLVGGAALKDASAYNVVFHGAHPVFIDVASIGRYEEGMPWIAYGQFCDHFLAPLMLEAYKGVAFQPLLRSDLSGVSISAQLAPLLGWYDLFRPGVLLHVKLRALLERRSRGLETAARREVRQLSVPRDAVVRNVRGLRRIVRKLESRAPSVWADYDRANSYDAGMRTRKEAFVASACERLGGGPIAFDWGANTGRFSRILARHYRCVVALDADAGAVDRLYHALRGTSDERAILPAVADLMNPPPAQGWRGAERQSLVARGRPDLAVYLALIHHVCLGQGVPLGDFVAMMRDIATSAIVEFVAIEDAMSQAVLATKRDAPPGYDVDAFRALLRSHAAIVAEEALSPTRTLFLVRFDAAA